MARLLVLSHARLSPALPIGFNRASASLVAKSIHSSSFQKDIDEHLGMHDPSEVHLGRCFSAADGDDDKL
jgi:hypothetical protein